MRTQSVNNYARSGKPNILQTEKALPWPSPMALDNGWDLQRINQSINQPGERTENPNNPRTQISIEEYISN